MNNLINLFITLLRCFTTYFKTKSIKIILSIINCFRETRINFCTFISKIFKSLTSCTSKCKFLNISFLTYRLTKRCTNSRCNI